MNALSMLTRGYVSPKVDDTDGVVIGPGPEIVDVTPLVPVIEGVEEVIIPGPSIIAGKEEE
jgi:hypothetical protein